MNVSLQQLLNYSKKSFTNFSSHIEALPAGAIPFTDSRGIHIYSDLRLRLSLSAADNIQTAQKYLGILQSYATAAEATTLHANIRILEVQGTRIHLFKDLPTVSSDELEQTIEACRVFFQLATQQIRLIAGQEDFTIRMAADWGRAILLLSAGEDESESIVSLGIPANRPAKHLAQAVGNDGVPAGHLAFNANALTNPYGAPTWQLIDLDEQLTRKSADNTRLTMFSAANEAYTSRIGESMILLNRSFSPNPKNPVHQPLRRQGFMFRADLDGFSNRVLSAMKGDTDDILKLVHEFHAIMQFPAEFKERLPEGVTVLQFPWAGDCANMLLECKDYSLERSYLPNIAALKWHDQGRSSENIAGRTNWRRLIGDTKWVVSIAGGDNHGADHGFILTGNVVADSRTFHVGAGWGWQRSLDGEQSKGTLPEETLIQMEDYGGLDECYQEPYRDHKGNPSLYKISSYAALQRNYLQQQNALKKSKSAILVSTGISVPAPRPYADF